MQYLNEIDGRDTARCLAVNVDKSTDVEDLCARLGEKYGGRVNGEVEISKFIPNKVKVGFAALLDDTKSVYAAWTRGPGDVWSNGLVDLEKLRKNRACWTDRPCWTDRAWWTDRACWTDRPWRTDRPWQAGRGKQVVRLRGFHGTLER